MYSIEVQEEKKDVHKETARPQSSNEFVWALTLLCS